MIQLNGVDFNNQAPLDIALEMMNRINVYCAENGIKNRDGEIVRLEANDASIIWQILLAQGYEDSVLQAMMIGVAANLSFVECSDDKLLEWARIMKVVRRKASFTTVLVTIEASTDGPVTVSETDTCTIRSGQSTITFRPVYDYTVPAGTSMPVIYIANISGPIEVAEGAITRFDRDKDNIASMRSAAGMPGRKEETMSELRWRMQSGNLHSGDVDTAMNMISQLPGVSFCRIIVNPGNSVDMTINGVTVHPRNAVVFVQGYSKDIASEYYKYMTANTASTTGDGRTIDQDFVTRAGQHIPFHFVQPSIADVVVRIYTDIAVAHAEVLRVEEVILSMNGRYNVGQQITSQDIIKELGKSNLSFNCIGAQIHTVGGEVEWRISSSIDWGSILRILRKNIEVLTWRP